MRIEKYEDDEGLQYYSIVQCCTVLYSDDSLDPAESCADTSNNVVTCRASRAEIVTRNQFLQCQDSQQHLQ